MKKVLTFLLFLSVSLNAKNFTVGELVTNHLSYLGYETTRVDNKLIAKHRSKPGLEIIFSKTGIIFRAWFKHKDINENELRNYVSFVNSLNNSSRVARFYIDSDYDLIVDGWYPLPYEKESFSNFTNAWLEDYSQIFTYNREVLQKYLQ
jgi:hypothetical protein